jgi:hypothetical protein
MTAIVHVSFADDDAAYAFADATAHNADHITGVSLTHPDARPEPEQIAITLRQLADKVTRITERTLP